MNSLTDRKFWENYWYSHKEEIEVKHKFNDLYCKIIEDIVKKHNINNSIELGGFPGVYSMCLKKLNVSPTLFDFCIIRDIMQSAWAKNGLKEDDIKCIEGDILKIDEKSEVGKYEFVFSLGLVEHFENTSDIIKKHIYFLDKEGVLLIAIPNFKGVNGWLQKRFDKENYKTHNINSMDIELLSKIASNLPLRDVDIKYDGGFSVWLENYKNQPLHVKVLFKSIWIIGKVLSKITSDNKTMSPYITLTAKAK